MFFYILTLMKKKNLPHFSDNRWTLDKYELSDKFPQAGKPATSKSIKITKKSFLLNLLDQIQIAAHNRFLHIG